MIWTSRLCYIFTMKNDTIQKTCPSDGRMSFSAPTNEDHLYNAYRWTKLIHLYFDRRTITNEDIEYQDFDILLALDAAHFMGKNISSDNLCETIKCDREHCIDKILRLEKMGFIKRSIEPEEKIEIINLTKKGLKIMQLAYNKLFSILELPATR